MATKAYFEKSYSQWQREITRRRVGDNFRVIRRGMLFVVRISRLTEYAECARFTR